MGVTGAFRRGALAACVALVALAPAAARAQTQPSPLQQPGQIAISADGSHLYVSDMNRVVALRRDVATGALAVIGSYNGGGTQIELAPDGRHVYVLAHSTGPSQSGLHTFNRDPASGELTYAGRWTQNAQGLSDLEFRDDRVLYVSDEYRDALHVLGRDPETGRLDRRTELRNGVDGVEGLIRPTGLAVTASTLYVNAWSDAINAFQLDSAGNPSLDPETDCRCQSATDVELTPNASHLAAGPIGPYLYKRDSAGRLSDPPYAPGTINSGGGELPDGSLAWSADGRQLYSTDRWNQRVVQFDHGASGLTVARSYYDGRDGQGLSQPRSIAVSPDDRFVYVAGGEYTSSSSHGIGIFSRDPGGGGLTFVSWFNPDRPDGVKPARVLINDGAEYTNDPEVTLSFENLPRETFTFEVANDGGFRESDRFGVDETNTYPWKLASTGPERLPKTVYVRLVAQGPYDQQPITDDIVLDERPPQVVSARRKQKLIALKARDTLSGVSHVQATRNPKKPGKWVKYAKSVKLPKGRGKVHVRVRDRARNRSKWKLVAP
jgi:6-phosphogluconolactonase (cycloisomerase 2 family)